MTKDSFYKIVIFLLLALNFGILGFLWMHHRPEHDSPPEGPDRLIIERLRLDEPQKGQFEELKHEHHSQMVQIQEQSGKTHQQLFDLLKKDPIDTAARNNLILALQQNDKQKELVTFEHFRKLRAILHPDQMPRFDALVQELSMHLLNLGPGRGK
jgi:protein CpxP